MKNNYFKTIFLDRDGVVNEDRDNYVQNLEQLNIFSYVPDAIAKLNQAGFKVIIISNQQGVAKGLYSEKELKEISDAIEEAVKKANGEIAAFYYCTHHKSENCDCRKPKCGMITRAADELEFDSKGCFFIGDSEKDLIAASLAECRPLLVLSGSTTRDMIPKLQVQPEKVFANLQDAADWVILQCSK